MRRPEHDTENWEKETLSLAKQINSWFCFRRKAKIQRLITLIRQGSACCEHGRVTDRKRLAKILNKVEKIVLKYV